MMFKAREHDHTSPEKDATVADLCGTKSEACNSIDVLKEYVSVSNVIPLWTCSNIEGQVEYQQDAATQKFKCEKELMSILEGEKKQVDAIVVDTSTLFAMAQIMNKIVSKARSGERF